MLVYNDLNLKTVKVNGKSLKRLLIQCCSMCLCRCGFRTGYMELVNVDPAVMLYTEVLLTGDLCPPVIGQIALDVMADPPHPGEPSYTLYTQVHAKTHCFINYIVK